MYLRIIHRGFVVLLIISVPFGEPWGFSWWGKWVTQDKISNCSSQLCLRLPLWDWEDQGLLMPHLIYEMRSIGFLYFHYLLSFLRNQIVFLRKKASSQKKGGGLLYTSVVLTYKYIHLYYTENCWKGKTDIGIQTHILLLAPQSFLSSLQPKYGNSYKSLKCIHITSCLFI